MKLLQIQKHWIATKQCSILGFISDAITPLDQLCCDHTGYDPANQICCNYRNEKHVVISKNSFNDSGCCFVKEDDGTINPKAYNNQKDLCCGQKLLDNASLLGYECCSKTQKPLVRCSIQDECREYNGSDTWVMSIDKHKEVPDRISHFRPICKRKIPYNTTCTCTCILFWRNN